MITFNRIAYKNGDTKKSKIYEYHAFCDCAGCKYRHEYLMQIRNQATATTKDIGKINEVKTFLENWKCKNGLKQLKTEYFKF